MGNDNELTEVPYQGPVNRFLHILSFYVNGFIACALKGKLYRYAYLCAQAKHETRNFMNAGFLAANNPFSMHGGTLSSRRIGVVDNIDGGNFAVYHRFGWAFKSWMDRLEWDAAMLKGKGVEKMKGKEYLMNVAFAGYVGKLPNETEKDFAARCVEYAESCDAWYKEVPGVIKAVSGIAAIGHFGPLSAIPGWLWMVSITLSLLYLLYFLIYKNRKKKK